MEMSDILTVWNLFHHIKNRYAVEIHNPFVRMVCTFCSDYKTELKTKHHNCCSVALGLTVHCVRFRWLCLKNMAEMEYNLHNYVCFY